jgi:hypothetical protein
MANGKMTEGVQYLHFWSIIIKNDKMAIGMKYKVSFLQTRLENRLIFL